jgi:hypothetical protein
VVDVILPAFGVNPDLPEAVRVRSYLTSALVLEDSFPAFAFEAEVYKGRKRELGIGGEEVRAITS